MTAKEAIAKTVEARRWMKEHDISIMPSRCPMCNYSCQKGKSTVLFKSGCNSCPILLLTGKRCAKHDKYYHWHSPDRGLGFILDIQARWNKRYPGRTK